MDKKESQLIGDLIRRIRGRMFHERDILILLILLRAHAPMQSPIRELGDFVAHREKDRGLLKTYIQHVVVFGEALRNNTGAQLKVEPVYSVKDFHDALNVVLTKLDMASLSSDIAHDAFVCVMSLLQEVRLHHNNEEIGHLSLYRFRRELWLCGIVVMPPKQVSVIFPALIVPNRYTSPADALVPFDGLVEAKCKDGRLQVYVGGRKAA